MRTKEGRAISDANLETMRDIADRMAAHHSELGAQLKSMREKHKAIGEAHRELDDFVSYYENIRDGGRGDDDGDGSKSGRPAPSRESIARMLVALD